MPALIDLRRRIKSVRNTQQITQAMKTVATAKFKKAQAALLRGRPSWHEYPDLLDRIADWSGRVSHPLLENRAEKKVLCLVLTSDKGLCGAFNSNLLDEAKTFLEDKACEAEVTLLLAGKKAVHFFSKEPYPIDWSCTKEVQKFADEDFKELAHRIIKQYVWNQTDAFYLIYNEFKSILAPTIVVDRILPIEADQNGDRPHFQQDENGGNGKWGLSPLFEPGMKPMMDRLLPAYIEDQIRHLFYESIAAEHAARMMSMDLASKNAGELIEGLTLTLNKIRQALITKELLEIISAVEALSKK